MSQRDEGNSEHDQRHAGHLQAVMGKEVQHRERPQLNRRQTQRPRGLWTSASSGHACREFGPCACGFKRSHKGCVAGRPTQEAASPGGRSSCRRRSVQACRTEARAVVGRQRPTRARGTRKGRGRHLAGAVPVPASPRQSAFPGLRDVENSKNDEVCEAPSLGPVGRHTLCRMQQLFSISVQQGLS